MPSINKFAAYKNIEPSYTSAVRKLLEKGLVLGEPAVVPYYTDSVTKNVRLVLGIGSLNGLVEIFTGTTADASTAFVAKIYYGAGHDYIAVMQNSIVSSTPYMTYNITVESDGDRIFVGFPAYMQDVRFEINGQITPTEKIMATIDGVEYVIHATLEAFSAGQYVVRALNTMVENSVSITAVPRLFRAGTATDVTIYAKCPLDADHIYIYDDRNNVIAEGSGTMVQANECFTDENPTSRVYKAKAVFGNEVLMAETVVKSVLLIYYGSGTSYRDATNETERETLSGRYDIVVENDGDRLYLLIPSGMRVDNITMNGFDIPMATQDILIDGYRYTVSESTNGYVAGTYQVMVNTADNYNPYPQEPVVYYGSGMDYTDVRSFVATDDPRGTYDITVETSGERIYIMIPNIEAPNTREWTFMMNGFGLPMARFSATINGTMFNVYESTNQYIPGEYRIIVS